MLETLQSVAGFILNLDLLATYGWRIVQGVETTILIVLVSCSLGFVLAFPICRARMSRNVMLSNLALAYITFFRGTPLLCQLYLIYYGSGEFRQFFTDIGLWWFFRDAFFSCILAFTMNTAAYQAEIFRGAINALGAEGSIRSGAGPGALVLPHRSPRGLSTGAADRDPPAQQ